ncbi:MAG: ComEC/Rec2 family competence protein [Candidatus Doudnabacteria bacterium]|nr:ComEC/Rec2 family competence protein [Candidatus Doudnabacteria bacterium]
MTIVARFTKLWRVRFLKANYYLHSLILLQICTGYIGGLIGGYYLGLASLGLGVLMLVLLRRRMLIFCLLFLVGSVVSIGFNEGENRGRGEEFGQFTVLQVLSRDSFVQQVIAGNDSGEIGYFKITGMPDLSLGDRVNGYWEPIRDGVIGSNYKLYLNSFGVNGFFSVKRGEVIANSLWPYALGDKVKQALLTKIDSQLAPPGSNLLAGMLLGEKLGFSDEFSDKLINVGVSHIVVVSGFNVMLVYGIFELAAGYLQRRVLIIFSLLGIGLYLLIVGPFNYPALRAVLMVCVSGVYRFFGYKSYPWIVLFAASAISLVFYPNAWLSISWQLSLVAMAGMLLMEKVLGAWLRHRHEIIKVLVSTLTASWVTVPVVAASFSTLAPIGILANLLLLPIVPVITILGLIALGLGDFDILANFLFRILETLLKAFSWVIDQFSATSVLITDRNLLLGLFVAIAFVAILIDFRLSLRVISHEQES